MQDNTNRVKDKQIRVDLIRVLLDVRDEFLQKLWLWLAIGLVTGVIGFVSAKVQYAPYYIASTSFTVSKHLAVNYHTSIEKDTVSNWIGIVAPDVIGGETMQELVKEGKEVTPQTSASDLCEMLKAKFVGGYTFAEGATGTNISWNEDGTVEKGAVKYNLK
jgi:hypothetical protein